MGNVSHLVTRTAALQSSAEDSLSETMPAKDRQFVTALARGRKCGPATRDAEGAVSSPASAQSAPRARPVKPPAIWCRNCRRAIRPQG